MHPFKTRPRSHGNAFRLAVIFAWGVLGLGSLQAQDNKMLEAELAKRKAMVVEARELIVQGDRAMQEGRPDLALQAYAGARELVPAVPVLEELRTAVTERFAVASLNEAANLANRGDLKAARALVDRVLDKRVDPEHPSALKMREMLNDPIRINPTLTPKHQADVDEVNRLILMANGAVALGRFDLATKTYEDILRIDPHNVLARRGLVQVLSLKEESKIAAYDQTRAEMLLEVEQAWKLPERPVDDQASALLLVDPPTSALEATLEAKMRDIIIPSVALEDVNLADAIEYLRVTSERLDVNAADPARRGINFTINLGSNQLPAVQAIQNKRFNLRLQNVPISEVLKYVTEMTGTAYRTDDHSVIIIPLGEVTDDVFMRRYSVPPDFITALSEDAGLADESDPFADNGPTNQGLLTQLLPVQELLKRKGVSFGEGASASYTAATNQLIVVNTAKNHSIIEQLIGLIKGADPVIVSVQVTMIKAQQKDLEELGFDWLLFPTDLGGSLGLGGGTAGNTPGRTVGDFSGTLPLLGGADAIAPNVITNGLRSGDRAFVANNLDAIINNPSRATQGSRVAPGVLSLTGLFSDGQAQVIMRGLSQKEGVDMVARPSVICRNGEQAEIVLAREFIYPTEYDPPELQQGGGNQNFNNNGGGQGNQGPAFPVVPANPTSFETREVGISLNVLPVAGEDKNYISVNLNPEIVEFDGFVNYGSPITVPVSDALGNISRVELTRNEILMPVFNTKRAISQLTVADGATVAFGGLLSQSIQSVEDKVPVLGDLPMLGRMFSSRSHQPISTAIVFLVKVDLMDPTGRPYRELRSEP